MWCKLSGNSNFVRNKQVAESCQHHLPSRFQLPFPPRNGTGSPPHSQAQGKDDEADVFVDVANEPPGSSAEAWLVEEVTGNWRTSLFGSPLRIGKIHLIRSSLAPSTWILNIGSVQAAILHCQPGVLGPLPYDLIWWKLYIWHRPEYESESSIFNKVSLFTQLPALRIPIKTFTSFRLRGFLGSENVSPNASLVFPKTAPAPIRQMRMAEWYEGRIAAHHHQ